MNDSYQNARVYAFGTFDGLHLGHWWYLRQARKLGSHLTVIVSCDINVTKIKGKPPMYSEAERVERLRRSVWADEVQLGGTGKPLDLLKTEEIDVICLGYQRPSTRVLHTELKRIGKLAVRVHRASAFFPGVFKSSRLKLFGIFR